MGSDSIAVTGHRLSTVTTASVTGDTVHELPGVDLATKLHYLRILYCFRPSETINGITTQVLKEPMFLMLDEFKQVAGRIRKNELGRPHIKCNDSGVRVIEANCERSMDEWLETKGTDWDGQLVPDKVLGPDLNFSPLFFVQFTRFKCGGLAVGVNWAHVLGDVVSASVCINLWGHLLAGKRAPQISHPSPNPTDSTTLSSATNANSRAVKQVEREGDLWLPRTTHRMVTSTFKLTRTKLNHLQSKVPSHIPAFEAISAVIWHSLAKIREGRELNLATIIRNDRSEEQNWSLGNKQIISTVTATDTDVSTLAKLIREAIKDEKRAIEEMVDRENGIGDFILYGANLTFVDMEGVDIYGFELKGQKPVSMEYNVGGVGDEGAVLVLPEPKDVRDGGDDGRKHVVVILPEHEMTKLKQELGSEWGIA